MYPRLFSIGPFTIHTYGLFLALAFLMGLRVAHFYAKREKLNVSHITDLVFYIFISALVGSKLLLIVVDFDYYSRDWHRLLSIYQVGGVFYGGLILAVVVTVWYVHKRDMNFLRTADVLTMGLAFGQIFGRMGCFFAGCCWGTEAPPGYPLSVTFTSDYAAKQVGTPLHIPLHPAQLYESIPMIAVFLILVYSWKHRRFEGRQLGLYLILYSSLRFTVEFFRGDPRGFLLNGLLSTSQFISLFAFAAGIALLFIRSKRIAA